MVVYNFKNWGEHFHLRPSRGIEQGGERGKRDGTMELWWRGGVFRCIQSFLDPGECVYPSLQGTPFEISKNSPIFVVWRGLLLLIFTGKISRTV